MNQLFKFHGNEIRTVVIEGEPWFVLRDVCTVLEVDQVAGIKRRLDDDVISNHPIPDALGRMQETTVINEDGLYDVVLESRKPEAKAFRKWITGEVIPAIRKTGSYSVAYKLPQSMPEALRLLAAQIEETETVKAEKEQLALENSEQKQKLQEQEAPVAIYNLAISAQNTMSMQEVSKALNTGRTRLYNFLRDEGVIMKNSTLPYQRFIEQGYFKVTERPRASGDTIVNDPATRVTAKGFDYIARLLKSKTA